MMIYTEITPNPSTLKFVTDQTLFKGGSLDIGSPAECAEAPVAQKLFGFSYVTAVFIAGNFISVTKDDSAKWEEVIPQVKGVMKAFLESGEPMVLRQAPEEVAVEEDETIRRIKKLLEENIRPAVAMDGGDVLFVSFEDGVVKLKMQGACSGCPSSSMTLKMGIQGLLTRMVPEVKSVESI